MRSLEPGRLLGLLVVLFFLVLSTVANAPAPWWACDGMSPGDRCEPYGAESGCGLFGADGEGECRQRADCTDDPSTPVNECLYCD